MSPRDTIDVSHLPDLEEGSRTPLWWAMVFLVVIEIAVFGTLVSGYFYLRVGALQWPPLGIEPSSLLLPTVYTVILLLSSGTMVWADRSVARGRMGQMTLGLLAGIVLALIFLGLKALEYSDKAYLWDTYAYGSIVWTITGFHAAHVIALVLKTMIITVQSRLGNFRQGTRLVIQINGIYWHFVVAIWIPLYIVLYLVPRL